MGLSSYGGEGPKWHGLRRQGQALALINDFGRGLGGNFKSFTGSLFINFKLHVGRECFVILLEFEGTSKTSN